MLTTLTLRNFKSIREQRYDFTQFDRNAPNPSA